MPLFSLLTPAPIRARKRLLPAALIALTGLSGCSALRPAADDQPTATTAQASHTENSVSAEQPETQSRPAVETEDSATDEARTSRYRPMPAATLYSLLVAEMAGQRQRFDISLYNYMDQARKTRDPDIAARATRIAQYVGSSSLSMEALGIWLDSDPHNPAAHQAAAQLYMEQGRFSAALEHLATLQELAGISQFDYLAANSGHLPQDKQRQLAQELADLQQRYPEDASLWYARAIMAQQLNQLPDAVSLIDRALDINPDYLSAGLQKARILALMEDYDAALDWLAELHEAHPEHKGVQVLSARIWLDKQDMKRALSEFTRLHENYPEDSAILLSLALLEHELGETLLASGHFDQLLARQSHTNEAHFYLGQIAETDGHMQTAIEHYAQVGAGREFLPAQLRAAWLVNDLQGVDAAREYLDSRRAENPDMSTELVRIEAEILSTAGLKDDALQLLSTALSVSPDNVDLLYTRAMLAEQVDNLAMLEQDLRTIIRLQPDHAEALNALGYTLADRTERWSEALPLIRRAMELSPDNPAVIDSLGWIYFRMGDFAQAGPLLAKAFSLMPDHEIAAHYGELLWLTGEQDKALGIWAAGLEQTPGSRIILRTLERLKISTDQLPASDQ
ncbi:MAG: hypothetical protein CMI02_11970 [Oceanospirillaceae bacterium]|nr:hypothetical protein [Oceanospirillaceae bacterium]MBT12736.1 hypothetical protein [Oceanospirillaceae bacterium]|tara:strand:- start:124631 stop:126499 length:1869 start_codon:yes stop_codon:yes gene_type:complete